MLTRAAVLAAAHSLWAKVPADAKAKMFNDWSKASFTGVVPTAEPIAQTYRECARLQASRCPPAPRALTRRAAR